MKLKVGETLTSAVDGATVIVVRTGGADVDLMAGGLPMYNAKTEPAPEGEPDPGLLEGSQIGKRYINEADDVELLATKPGKGTLVIDGVPLRLRDAKPLPASD